MECPRKATMDEFVNGLKNCRTMDRADRLLALDAVKQAICPCLTLCRNYQNEFIEGGPNGG
jgi:hypothetical protein